MHLRYPTARPPCPWCGGDLLGGLTWTESPDGTICDVGVAPGGDCCEVGHMALLEDAAFWLRFDPTLRSFDRVARHRHHARVLETLRRMPAVGSPPGLLETDHLHAPGRARYVPGRDRIRPRRRHSRPLLVVPEPAPPAGRDRRDIAITNPAMVYRWIARVRARVFFPCELVAKVQPPQTNPGRPRWLHLPRRKPQAMYHRCR